MYTPSTTCIILNYSAHLVKEGGLSGHCIHAQFCLLAHTLSHRWCRCPWYDFCMSLEWQAHQEQSHRHCLLQLWCSQAEHTVWANVGSFSHPCCMPLPSKMPLPSQKATKGKKTDVRCVWKEPERSKWITCWGKKQHRYLYHVGRDEWTRSTSYQSGKRAHRAIPQPIWRLCAFCTHTFFNLSSWEHTGFNESAVWSTPLMTVHTEHYAVYRVKTKLLQMVNSSILHTEKSKE